MKVANEIYILLDKTSPIRHALTSLYDWYVIGKYYLNIFSS